MKRRVVVLAIVWTGLGSMTACSKGEAPPVATSFEMRSAPSAGLGTATAGLAVAPAASAAASTTATSAPSDEAAPAERKIVRSADLGIEAVDPVRTERDAIQVVEGLGGHVATTERSLHVDPDRADDTEGATTVTMTLSVPSDRFMSAVGRLEKLGSRTVGERIGSDDVTYEFIDVKARLDAARALEKQFLEILKQAVSVKDALDVNTRISEVRANIEQLEGRQRFLERQTSFSTIKLSIAPLAPLVRAGRFAFGDTVDRALADLLNVTAGIVHGTIRGLGVLVPIAIFVVPPFALVRTLVRRRRRAFADV